MEQHSRSYLAKKISQAYVVDDDEIYTFSIKRIMTRSDIAEKTYFFHNGKLALDSLTASIEQNAQLPDLILLDLNMPILDGWQFLDEFVKLKPWLNRNIHIYIVSSSIDEADIRKAKSIESVSDFIVKPLSEKELFAILDEIDAMKNNETPH